jgi:L-fuconolactonase
VTEANPDWQADDLRSYVQHLLDTFGPSRLIWGSDWPVCTLASTYERWLDTTNTLLSALTQPERDAVLGGNAAGAYYLRD